MAIPDGSVRRMVPEDVPAVAAIERECFASPWSEQSFLDELQRNRCARYMVVMAEGSVVGYGGMWLILTEAHVTNIAVSGAYRGRGYARLLMKGLMREAFRVLEITEMTLEVRVSNEVAISLYQSMGFTIEGRRRGYYEDTGEDAYIMWCRNTLVNLTES